MDRLLPLTFEVVRVGCSTKQALLGSVAVPDNANWPFRSGCEVCCSRADTAIGFAEPSTKLPVYVPLIAAYWVAVTLACPMGPQLPSAKLHVAPAMPLPSPET